MISKIMVAPFGYYASFLFVIQTGGMSRFDTKDFEDLNAGQVAQFFTHPDD